MEDGVSYADTAVREVMEETGIILDINKLIELPKLVKYRNRSKYLKSFYYIADESIRNQKLVCDSTFEYKGVFYPENEDFKWIKYDVANEHIHYTQLSHLEILKDKFK